MDSETPDLASNFRVDKQSSVSFLWLPSLLSTAGSSEHPTVVFAECGQDCWLD